MILCFVRNSPSRSGSVSVIESPAIEFLLPYRYEGIPDCRAVAHNEEHLVVETPAADRFKPGDVLYAIPSHICPTVALSRARPRHREELQRQSDPAAQGKDARDGASAWLSGFVSVCPKSS